MVAARSLESLRLGALDMLVIELYPVLTGTLHVGPPSRCHSCMRTVANPGDTDHLHTNQMLCHSNKEATIMGNDPAADADPPARAGDSED